MLLCRSCFPPFAGRTRNATYHCHGQRLDRSLYGTACRYAEVGDSDSVKPCEGRTRQDKACEASAYMAQSTLPHVKHTAFLSGVLSNS